MKLCDEDILKYCFIDNKGNLSDKIVKNKIVNMSSEMVEYLHYRFNDSESINESIYRIKYNIEKRPVCLYCKNKVQYLGVGKYRKFCSTKCNGKYNQNEFYIKTGLKSSLLQKDIQDKSRKTLIEKYGVDNISKSEKIKEIKKQSFLNHYGYKNNFCNDSILKKAIEKSTSEEANTKRKNTCLKKYNSDYYLSTLKGKCLSDEHKYKISNIVSSKEFQNKRFKTMMINNSFNKSKFEELVYFELLKYTDKENVIRQYKSTLYPWRCDFYIKSKDIYIEAQGSHFHHFHPFDKENKDDIEELEILNDKKLDHPQYESIITTWTIRDVYKRNMAKKNGLKYIEIFPNDDYKKIIETIFLNNEKIF